MGRLFGTFTPAAVLIDSQEILQQDESGSCNSVTIPRLDRWLKASRLMAEPARSSEWHYRRPGLDEMPATDCTGLRDRWKFSLKAAGQLGEAIESKKGLPQTSG